MNPSETALLLIGFQNDFFSESGVLREAIAESADAVGTLQNTTRLIAGIAETSTPILSTPIVFTEDYRELKDPIGILKAVRDSGAFKEGEPGCETVPELLDFGSRIELVMGRQTFNSFSNTDLLSILQARGIKDLLIAGVITSACIDSTARTAFEEGFRVTVLSDCTAGRNHMEQDFFCESVFPTFAYVSTADKAQESLTSPAKNS